MNRNAPHRFARRGGLRLFGLTGAVALLLANCSPSPTAPASTSAPGPTSAPATAVKAADRFRACDDRRTRGIEGNDYGPVSA